MTGADYADDLVIFANTPAQAESLLHSLGQAAGGIVLCVNANKTEFKCLKQERATSTVSGKALKLVDQKPYQTKLYIFMVSLLDFMAYQPL